MNETAPLFDIAGLRHHLEAGATVITSNARLSRQIRGAWHRDRSQDAETWDEPPILPLESWLQQCWLALLDGAYTPALAGAVASPHQETVLWRRVIERADDLPATANPANFADLARRGWKLVRQWRVDERSLQGAHPQGARLLSRWGREFETLLAEHHLISPEQRAEIVCRGFAEAALAPLPAVVLVGFQSLPPLHRAALESGSHRLDTHLPPPRRGSQERMVADDLALEIAAAAHWAHSRARENPGARIGVVVPRLTAIQPEVERIFCNTLDPEWLLPTTGYRPTPYNISAAAPLAAAPPVAAALALLALLGEQLAVADYCRLLVSPFWGSADSETGLRCQAQVTLRDLGLHQLSPSRFRQLLHRMEGEPPQAGAPTLSQRLSRLATRRRELPAKGRLRQWRETFEEALAILGWPGERSPDSLEYQQLQHWRDLLDTLATLDEVSGAVSSGAALQLLAELARNTPFHPETPDRQIQILGTLEGAGLAFDHLWVMNMEDRQWPEAVSPHPLLPVPLQREMAMPRAQPEHELALSRELFELFAGSAREVVFSHCRRDGDVNLKPALFLENLPEYSGDGDTLHPWWRPLHAAARRETVDDASGPGYLPADGKLRGGSRFLSDQAQCPFNAFARWRLGAEPLAEPVSGLGPLWRGILVHDCLELLWREMRNSGELLRLDEEERRQRLEQAADAALDNLFRRQGGVLLAEDFGRRLLSLERQRLVRLLESWLQVEMTRAPFEVAHTELQANLVLAGYSLTLRLDRVDRLEDGALAIIDYKTGQAGIGTVAGERLLEAQLPLYALALQAQTGAVPAAVSYARINVRNLGLDGLAEQAGLLPGCKALTAKGLPDTWEETLAQWQTGIQDLLGEIRSGSAEVAFYSRDAASRGGDLVPLNRWPDLERLAAASLLPPDKEEAYP